MRAEVVVPNVIFVKEPLFSPATQSHVTGYPPLKPLLQKSSRLLESPSTTRSALGSCLGHLGRGVIATTQRLDQPNGDIRLLALQHGQALFGEQ